MVALNGRGIVKVEVDEKSRILPDAALPARLFSLASRPFMV
jgi:hypothetical protein